MVKTARVAESTGRGGCIGLVRCGMFIKWEGEGLKGLKGKDGSKIACVEGRQQTNIVGHTQRPGNGLMGSG